MNKLNKLLRYLLAGFLVTFTACDGEDPRPIFTIDFEDVSFPAGADAYYGQDKEGEAMGTNDWGYTKYFSMDTSGMAAFPLTYFENEEGNNYWSGVAFSKQTDNSLEELAGQFVAMPGQGADGTQNYAVMNGADTITFVEGPLNVQSIQLSNNAYAYYAIKNGNQFAKKFGGVDGTDPDFFKVVVTGLDEQGSVTGSTEFYLADFRFEDNSQDYIADSWETLDLSPLGNVKKLAFSYQSSDASDWGMNTPAYVALDKLVARGLPLE